MKVLTWNVNRAGKSRLGLWKKVLREDADIILLQEVTGIPEWIRSHYQCHQIRPRYFEGTNAPFATAVLTKGAIDSTPYLKSALEWVNKIKAEQYGWIVEDVITFNSGERFQVVAVHVLPTKIPQNQWTDLDVTGVKLNNNPDLWFTEILWTLLRTANITNDRNWIVGGDFNTSVRLDIPRNRGNQEIIDRLNSLGLTDCLSHYHHGGVATYQNMNKVVKHQLDYCYVNATMLDRLTQVRVPKHEEVFDQKPRLSDHLPIVCEFD